jgi:hypothetical protein
MELPIFKTFINFSRHQFRCFTVASLFVLDKSAAWNWCLQHPRFKNLCPKIAQASKNSDSNAQHFPFGFANTFMISLHALCTPGYQFPYAVMNRCFYLTLEASKQRVLSIYLHLTSNRVQLIFGAPLPL